jgi:hypothetical protein
MRRLCCVAIEAVTREKCSRLARVTYERSGFVVALSKIPADINVQKHH